MVLVAACISVFPQPDYSYPSQDALQDRIVQLEQNRERCENFQGVLTALNLAEGKQVADVGAGIGFYTIRIARVVGPKGRVFGVDIGQREIDVLRQRVEKDRARMIVPTLGADDDPRLPAGVLDAVLIVNSYHEMNKHQAMLEHIHRALKSTGVLVIVEPISSSNRRRPRDFQEAHHEIGSNFVEADLADAAFKIVQRRDPFAYSDKSCGKFSSYNTDIPDWWMIVARVQ